MSRIWRSLTQQTENTHCWKGAEDFIYMFLLDKPCNSLSDFTTIEGAVGGMQVKELMDIMESTIQHQVKIITCWVLVLALCDLNSKGVCLHTRDPFPSIVPPSHHGALVRHVSQPLNAYKDLSSKALSKVCYEITFSRVSWEVKEKLWGTIKGSHPYSLETQKNTFGPPITNLEVNVLENSSQSQCHKFWWET